MLPELLKEQAGMIDSKLEAFLPRRIDDAWILKNIGPCEWHPDVVQSFIDPIWEFLDRGGKRWRPILMLLCAEAVGDNQNAEVLIPVVELIHNGTLMVDDIEDDSDVRRGAPAIHRQYGEDVAINTGNLMYYLPYLALKHADLSDGMRLQLHEIISDEMIKIHFGQGMDIYWHNGGKPITEALYLQMCAFKTGTLARMSAKLGVVAAGGTEQQMHALGRFAESLGIAFQIQDDILNITNQEWGKELGDDITEGKRTLLVIRALEESGKADRLRDILAMKTKEKAAIEEAIQIIQSTDAIGYAKSKANSIVKEAWERIEDVLDDSTAKRKLRMFADFVVERDL